MHARDAAPVILTEWDEFPDLDYSSIYQSMIKPAHLFDGRNLPDLEKLKEIGFKVSVNRKSLSSLTRMVYLVGFVRTFKCFIQNTI